MRAQCPKSSVTPSSCPLLHRSYREACADIDRLLLRHLLRPLHTPRILHIPRALRLRLVVPPPPRGSRLLRVVLRRHPRIVRHLPLVLHILRIPRPLLLSLHIPRSPFRLRRCRHVGVESVTLTESGSGTEKE